MSWEISTEPRTLHKPDCNRAFKNYDKTCPRCQELMAGCKPREGYVSNFALAQRKRQIEAIRNHQCSERSCGPVCTFGEW